MGEAEKTRVVRLAAGQAQRQQALSPARTRSGFSTLRFGAPMPSGGQSGSGH